MTKSKQRQRLSGTVLIMILTVMFVLIIMLMATLTVVTTASQRIYTKFEENQAYYTSRSALEVVTKTMLNDNNYISTNANIGSGTADQYQGFQMQAALYTVRVKEADGTIDADKNENIYGAVNKDFLQYEITLPTLGNAGDKYGSFSDGNIVDIKIEVLDRVYDCGSDGQPDTGNRADDMMKIKVTATSEVNGVEGTASVLLETGPSTGAINNTRAVTTLGDATIDPNNAAILGGIATYGGADMENQGDYWGNVYIGGDMSNGNGGSRITLVDDEWFYVKGNVTGAENAFPLQGITTNPAKKPAVYVDGDFFINMSKDPGKTTGTATNPITLMVKGDFGHQSNGFVHYGDLYVLGDFKPVGTDLTVNGNLYVVGDFDKSSCNQVKVTGDLHLGQILYAADGVNLTVDGHVYMPTVTGTGLYDNGNTHYDGTQRLPTVDDTSDPAFVHITFADGIVKKVPTTGGLYTQFYRYDDMTEGCITASEYAFTSQEDFEDKKYSDKRIHEYYDENANAATTIQITAGTNATYSDPGFYHLLPGQNTFIEFNAPGGEIELFVEPGSYGSGGGVVVHSGTKVKVYMVPGYYSFDNFYFTTDEVLYGSGNLYVGNIQDPDNGIYLMEIPTTIYVEGNAKIYMSNNNSYFVANIYAPRADIDAYSSGSTGFRNRMYYNLVSYEANRYNSDYGFSVIGSVLANQYDTGGSGKGSVAYVESSNDDTPPPDGYPFLVFQDVKYSRN